MKKRILKIFTMIFCMALFLTGCATVSRPTDSNGNKIVYEDIHYNQGQVLTIGDYLYFANGYNASDSDSYDYKASAQYTSLSRIKLGENLTFKDDVDSSKWATTTPNGVESVNSKMVFGSQLQNMFALGEYIYFASPNQHKTKDMESDFSKVSLYRMKFDGSGVKELIKNTAFTIGSKGNITVQKGDDGNYYIIIVEEGESSTFTIKSLKIGNKIGKLNILAEKATSYAIADENSTQKDVLFTVADEERPMGAQIIKSVNFKGGEAIELDKGVALSTTTFLGRVGDVVFYYYKHVQSSKDGIYYKHLEESDYPIFNEKGEPITNPDSQSEFKDEHFAPADSQFFFQASTISKIAKTDEGYTFKTEGGALLYCELGKNPVTIFTDTEYSDLLFIENDYVYVSNSTSIKRASVNFPESKEEIVKVTDMVSGKCGYDGEYIYFYSKIMKTESDTDETDNTTTDTTEEEQVVDNYYMHRVDKNGNLQLIGKTITQKVDAE